MCESILQQSRCGTFAGAGRRDALSGVAEYIGEVGCFAAGISHHKQLEKAILQLSRHRFALSAELSHFEVETTQFGKFGQRFDCLLGGTAATLEFGFGKLASCYHIRFDLRR